MTLRIVDLSSHNGVVNHAALVAAGYAGVVVKLTGGTEYVNPNFRQQLFGARDAGMLTGVYHYDGEPTVAGGTAQQEAAHFLDQLPADLPPGTLIALDAEERTTRDPARYDAWRRVVGPALRATPLLYSFWSFIAELDPHEWAAVADMPLWLARYWTPYARAPLPAAPTPWARWVMWQWTGGSPVPGIGSPTDENLFDGTADDWRALGTAGDNAPQQPPAPPGAPESVRAYIDARGHAILEIDYGGDSSGIAGVNVADAGISTIGRTDGATYDRSVKANVFEPWRRRP